MLTSACPPAIAYSRVDTGWTPSFLPSTQALDPGATGFYVLEAFLGGQYTLAKEGSPPEGGLIFNVSGGAPPFGTYVLANLVQSDGNTIATANGGGRCSPEAHVLPAATHRTRSLQDWRRYQARLSALACPV